MPQYFLQVGNTPALTLAEAQAVCDPQAELLDHQVVSFTTKTNEQAEELFNLLGAAVKVIRVDLTTELLGERALENQLLKQLLATSPEKIQFSITYWGDQLDDFVSPVSLKKALKSQGIKVRFIQGSKRGLSAAVLLNQAVQELVVFIYQNKMFIGHTLAVQDIDHWTVKDRRKPYVNRKKGMLPPKVARVMVNLALGGQAPTDTLVYDPFCGTGTILLEALERGVEVIGSDLDKRAVMGTAENLGWFSEQLESAQPFTVFQSQVAKATIQQLPRKVDAIITEPFLGKPTPQANQLPGIFKGLEKLYLGAFNQWRGLLKNKATVVMIFPRVVVDDQTIFDFKNFVDKLRPRGYTLQVDLGALRYHRRDAIVQRDIGIFTYSTPK